MAATAVVKCKFLRGPPLLTARPKALQKILPGPPLLTAKPKALKKSSFNKSSSYVRGTPSFFQSSSRVSRITPRKTTIMAGPLLRMPEPNQDIITKAFLVVSHIVQDPILLLGLVSTSIATARLYEIAFAASGWQAKLVTIVASAAITTVFGCIAQYRFPQPSEKERAIIRLKRLGGKDYVKKETLDEMTKKVLKNDEYYIGLNLLAKSDEDFYERAKSQLQEDLRTKN